MEKVTFGDTLPGYVCGDPTHPGVVVVQEWWGVTETIQEHALRISQEGYRVLVPDLYKGALGVNVEEAHHLMSNLDWDAATGTTREANVRSRRRETRASIRRRRERSRAKTKLTTRALTRTPSDPKNATTPTTAADRDRRSQSRYPPRCPTCAPPARRR